MRTYLRTRRHICNLIDSCYRLDSASLSACARRKSDRNLPRNRSDGSDGCQSVPASPGPWQAAMMSRSTLAEACWDLSRACSTQGRSSFVLSSCTQHLFQPRQYTAPFSTETNQRRIGPGNNSNRGTMGEHEIHEEYKIYCQSETQSLRFMQLLVTILKPNQYQIFFAYRYTVEP